MKKIISAVLLSMMIFIAACPVQAASTPTADEIIEAFKGLTDNDLMKIQTALTNETLDRASKGSTVNSMAKTAVPAVTATPNPSAAQYETLRVGSSGSNVLRLKNRLYELGYFTSNSFNDQYTGTTSERVMQFQAANGLSQTGTADSETQAVLYSANAKPKKSVSVSSSKSSDGYQTLNYQTYARNPEIYKGQKFKITGKIVQVLGSRKDGYELRVATKNGYDDVCYVYVPFDPGYALLEDDKVIIRAVAYETITYSSIWGQEITIPFFAADSITIQ